MTSKPERVVEADGITPEQNRHALSFAFGRRGSSLRTRLSSSVSPSHWLCSTETSAQETSARAFDQWNELSGYKLYVTPRNPAREKKIRFIELEHPWEQSDAATLENVVY
ncbi:LOW QUALITY PROTEIN: hypothetical protein IFM46972_07651 [Aspergillus udagawae]|uniref:Uncharacterized protein n=1 Tax=Aspergillus udagawae TaxID=91492 RepID=A0A8H3S0K8_9EURO|nr:LOW QUALITY PROTEIN: hypothetical protein IFM46972_07651 [Aspergillus udagawae]